MRSLLLLALALPASASASTFLHWSFDGDLSDTSGNGNDGILSELTEGATSFSTSSIAFGDLAWSNQANAADCAYFTTPFEPGGATPWTVSFWQNMRGGASAPLFDDTSRDNLFSLVSTGSTRASVTIQGELFQFDLTGAIGQYSHNHVVLVADPGGIAGVDQDGDGNEDNLAVYIDGVLMPTSSTDLHLAPTDVYGNNFGNGSSLNYATSSGHGIYDELWIFEGDALTAEQIQSLYTTNNACVDDDGDGVDDCLDVCPEVDASTCDLDLDGCIDDDDADGVDDCFDLCPSEDSVGCDANADGCIDDDDANGTCDLDQILTVSPSPIYAGSSAVLTAIWAAPGERVFFAASRTGAGEGPCGVASSGTEVCAGLLGMVQLGSAVADADGLAQLSVQVPASLADGTPLWFQVAQLSGDGAISEVVETTAQEVP